MPVEARVKRIGGSTFARLPPQLVKSLGLADGDMVNITVTRRGKTLKDLDGIVGAWQGNPELRNVIENWSDERPGQDPDWYESGPR